MDLSDVKKLVEGKIQTQLTEKKLSQLKNRVGQDINRKREILRLLNTLQTIGLKKYYEYNIVRNEINISDVDFFELINKGIKFEKKDNYLYAKHETLTIKSRLMPSREDKTLIVEPFFFWYTNQHANNLVSFIKELEKLPQESFKHHFNNDDFYLWLKQFNIENLDEIFKETKKLENKEQRKEFINKLY